MLVLPLLLVLDLIIFSTISHEYMHVCDSIYWYIPARNKYALLSSLAHAPFTEHFKVLTCARNVSQELAFCVSDVIDLLV